VLQQKSITRRLVLAFGGMFAIALLGVGLMTQIILSNHAQGKITKQFETTSVIFNQLWQLKAKALVDAAEILSRDFGFREAVATNDKPTMVSALVNLRARVGADRAFIVLRDGGVISDGVGEGSADLKAAIASLPYKLPQDRNSAVAAYDEISYKLVVAPILAPMEIGWVVFAVEIDEKMLRELGNLSENRINAYVVELGQTQGWQTRNVQGQPIVALFNDHSAQNPGTGPRQSLKLRGDSAQVVAYLLPLEGVDGTSKIGVLLSFPFDVAMQEYRTLQLSLAGIGLLGFALVIVFSARLSRKIAEPIMALDAAARSLLEGRHEEVDVNSDDEVGRLASSFNMMSREILEREQRIHHLALHDSLTNLPNRSYFRQQLDGFISHALKHNSGVAVFCLDLENYQSINDNFGDAVGDRLLCQIGETLVALAGDTLVSRLGGDEFGIVMLDVRSTEQPQRLAQAILERFSEPFEVDGRSINLGIRIGIALAPNDGSNAKELLMNAEFSLTRAKQEGSALLRFFQQSIDEEIRKRQQLELDMREALHNGEFRLYFQPLWSVSTQRFESCEALIRWQHPKRGMVSPAEFIPLAEDSGLIVPIGEWVLREACRVAARWPSYFKVAVNVSVRQLREPGFAACLFQALSNAGLAADRLEIELTESLFAEGSQKTSDVLNTLRSMGVRTALDDFGTGYSSLSYLRNFPFNKIKIDKSFIDKVVGDPSQQAIVRAIIDLANALSMETTTEGVEDAAQLSTLTQMGCTSIQGYYFSKPVPEQDLQRFFDWSAGAQTQSA
jgi:diguanylate cyclase (GGDEF)-like protein